MLIDLFVALLIVGFAISIMVYFRVKLLLKKLYPEKHDEVFSKTLVDHSVRSSLNFTRFTFKESEWEPISDPGLLKWLRINKMIAVFYYGLGVFAIFSILYAIVKEFLF